MRSFLMAGTPVNGCNIIFVLLHEREDGKGGFWGALRGLHATAATASI